MWGCCSIVRFIHRLRVPERVRSHRQVKVDAASDVFNLGKGDKSEPRKQGRLPRGTKTDGHIRGGTEIVITLPGKAYVGVKHSVGQKPTDLRGEAHLQSKTTHRSIGRPLVYETKCSGFESRCENTKSKRLLPWCCKSALIHQPSGNGGSMNSQGDSGWYQSRVVQRLATTVFLQMSRVSASRQE